MSISTLHRPAAMFALCAAILSAGPLCASPLSQAVVDEGYEYLQKGKLQIALRKFAGATLNDPKDADAWFFKGVAENRLEQFADATTSLTQAKTLGDQHGDLLFELGWALMRSGQPVAAIESLKAYEQAHPGRAQTSEFLGRAYYDNGQLDLAEQSLNEAMSRDADAANTVRPFLAAVQAKRGDTRGMLEELRKLYQDSPNSQVAKTLAQGGQPGSEKPWRLSISAGGGYNSNVIGIGDGIALPADISNEGGFFGRFTVDAAYDVFQDADQTVTLGYVNVIDIYESDHRESDTVDQYFYGRYSRRLTDRLSGSLRIADQWTRIGGNNFRNTISVRPALAYKLSDWVVGEVAYSFAHSSYEFPTTAILDRDSNTHGVSAAAHFRFPRTEWTGSFGYAFGHNNADGADYDYQSHTLYVNLSHPLPWDMAVDVYYAHIVADYENLNSLSGFTTPRDDAIDVVTLQLTKQIDIPQIQRARVYVRYDLTRNDSDIAVFDYTQHVISAGLIVDF